MRHTIQTLVENKFGVLARVASLFSARGYNIISLAVGETLDPSVSCMTIVVNAEDERILEQIKKQLNKLIDVITVVDITRKDYIDRELILFKVSSQAHVPAIIESLAKRYPFEVLAKGDHYILSLCADHQVIGEFLKEIKELPIKELVRTGKIAISK